MLSCQINPGLLTQTVSSHSRESSRSTTTINTEVADFEVAIKSFMCRTIALVFVPIYFALSYMARNKKADTPELSKIDEFIMYFKTI